MRRTAGAREGGLFFRDRRANDVFILAFLLTLPAAFARLDAANLLPNRFFGST